MKTLAATEHFGSQSATARALEMDPSTVCGWGAYPPPLRQLQLEALTDGVLKAEPDCDKYRVAVKAAA